MYRIGKKFRFSASHQLDQLPTRHPCRQMHGHNYEIEIVLQREELDRYGFLEDFGWVKEKVAPVLKKYDHRHLNEVMALPPTAEHLALSIYQTLMDDLPCLVAVRVWETPDSWAEYYYDRYKED